MKGTKYRAWDLDLKKMYYGAFSVDARTGQVIDAGWKIEGGGKNCILLENTGSEDKNENPLYEKDVAIWKNWLFIIEWDTDLLSWVGKVINSNFYIKAYRFKEAVKKGNIYENPELSKETK